MQVHQGRGAGLGAISPKVVVQNLRMIGKQFRLGRQVWGEDATHHIFFSEVKVLFVILVQFYSCNSIQFLYITIHEERRARATDVPRSLQS